MRPGANTARATTQIRTSPMMIQALAFNKMANEEGSCSRNHAAAAERLSPKSIRNAGIALPESTRSAQHEHPEGKHDRQHGEQRIAQALAHAVEVFSGRIAFGSVSNHDRLAECGGVPAEGNAQNWAVLDPVEAVAAMRAGLAIVDRQRAIADDAAHPGVEDVHVEAVGGDRLPGEVAPRSEAAHIAFEVELGP